MRIFGLLSDLTACGYYRVFLPALHLGPDLASRGIDWTVSREVQEEHHHFDAYVFGRVPGPIEFAFALQMYQRDAKIVWDLDDDFINIPEWSPVKEQFGPVSIFYLTECLKMANHITVSTQPLADAVRAQWPALGGKVVVLENLIDPAPFIDVRPNQSLPVRLFWSGSRTHEGDLAPLRAVKDFVQTHPGYILTMFGHLPDDFSNKKNIYHIGWGKRSYYEGILSQLSPDIAFLPLLDCPFNRCKSAIKFYEMTMAGAVCIASNVIPFSDVINDGITGILLPHDRPDLWTQAVETHASRHSDVEDIKTNARREVIESYSWRGDSIRRRAWMNFYANL